MYYVYIYIYMYSLSLYIYTYMYSTYIYIVYLEYTYIYTYNGEQHSPAAGMQNHTTRCGNLLHNYGTSTFSKRSIIELSGIYFCNYVKLQEGTLFHQVHNGLVLIRVVRTTVPQKM